jgi:hypothetical protein
MNHIVNISKRASALLAALLLVAGVAIPTIVPSKAHASQLTSRKITLSSSANGTISVDAGGNAVTAGAGGNGTKAQHTVTFTMASSAATVGSILIMYCDSPIPISSTCTTPTGLTAQNLTAATVVNSGGVTGAGNFSIDTTTTNAALPTSGGVCNGASTTRTNCVAIKAGSGQVQSGTPTFTIQYGGGGSDYITNPTTDNYSFYARIQVFQGTNYTTQVDYGSVAASTAQQIDITAKVQEVLNFSVGVGSPPGTLPGSCGALSDSGALTLGDTNGVLSLTTQYDAHSYFRVNTNTLNGTVIQYSGDTLKSGANSIAALSSEVTTAAGTEAFGLSFDSGDGNYSLTNLTRTSGYDEGNGALGTAKFNYSTGSTTSPVTLASSSGAVSCDTGAIRYIGDINTTTRAGIYTTTVTYIAIGTY